MQVDVRELICGDPLIQVGVVFRTGDGLCVNGDTGGLLPCGKKLLVSGQIKVVVQGIGKGQHSGGVRQRIGGGRRSGLKYLGCMRLSRGFLCCPVALLGHDFRYVPAAAAGAQQSEG